MIQSSAMRIASSALRQMVSRSGSRIVRTMDGATITVLTGPWPHRQVLLESILSSRNACWTTLPTVLMYTKPQSGHFSQLTEPCSLRIRIRGERGVWLTGSR